MKTQLSPLVQNNYSLTDLIPYFELCLNTQVYKADVVSKNEISKTNFFSISRYSGNDVILNAHNITDVLEFNILGNKNFQLIKNRNGVYYLFFFILGSEYNLKLHFLDNSTNKLHKFFINYIQQYVPDFDINDYNKDDIQTLFSMINI